MSLTGLIRGELSLSYNLVGRLELRRDIYDLA